jgi:AcrR family transcriptional regulator
MPWSCRLRGRKLDHKNFQEAAMAKKPARSRTGRSKPRASSAGDKPARERAIDALMALLAEKRFEQIALTEIASAADVSLAELRDTFGSKLAILGGFTKDIDRAVLSGGDADMADEPPRERLFDVLMRRLEALAPYRPAIQSLVRSARCNPGLALALNRMATRSQQWMLAAAAIESSGPKGMIRAQGLALMFAAILRTWFDDEDEGLARTMAALDRALARGQHWSGLLDDVCRIPAGACAIRSRFRARRRRDEPMEEQPVV